MNWLKIAENLPTGHKVRQNCHECGNSNNSAVINHNVKDYSYFCFACGHTEVEPKGKQTLAELQKLKELNDAAETYRTESIELPSDTTYDLPLVARLWLYNGGISPTVWEHYRIGWSESLQRVVLPVYSATGSLVWYQLRAVHAGQRPKYIQPSQPRDTIFFKVGDIKSPTTKCVVVEDILSAIRVGKFVDTISILGTRPSSKHINELAKYSKVITWMDSDRAGRKSAYTIRKAVSMLTDVGNILTDADPKRLSDNQIKEQLCKLT